MPAALDASSVDVTIVMPCLNEARGLATCLGRAVQALALIRIRHGFSGEIVVADNGSSDGSQEIARGLGARVVSVAERGYGAAVLGGFAAARGRYLVMGDADGSYDFIEAVPMIASLTGGADLCLGSRFKGGIHPGAMPWKNRYLGNPVLTGILNLLFSAGVEDAHCGLRALTRGCLDRLRLAGAGMELASEMIIKASLLGMHIVEVPATLAPDLRGRPPHLRPWRDGWRHLRYLFMLSPAWLFAAPAGLGGAFSIGILLAALHAWLRGTDHGFPLGNYWVILAGSLLTVSHLAGILALASHLYGIREGYRQIGRGMSRMARFLSLETMLLGGAGLMLTAMALLGGVVIYWSVHHFGQIGNVLPAVLGTSLFAMGVQTVLGGFLLAIIGGNEAQFLRRYATAKDAGRSRRGGAAAGLSPRLS